MGILDANIRNNLFTEAGSIGASAASSAISSTIRNQLFTKLGNSVIGNSIGGFLGTNFNTLLRNTLFTRKGASGQFDPVWKLGQYHLEPDPNTGDVGSLLKAVADDFAGAGAPKYKFNYTVEIVYGGKMNDNLPSTQKNSTVKVTNLTNDVSQDFNSGDLQEVSVFSKNTSPSPLEGSEEMGKIEFALKTATRPQPTVNFVDVNFYNYRTKIATKMEYGQLTITLYDDIRNRAHDIFDLYLKSVSPIANVDANGAFFFQTNAVTGNMGSTGFQVDPSSIGKLEEIDSAGLISSIIINHQLPLDYSTSSVTGGGALLSSQIPHMIIKYHFMNPKIITMALDDLDMTQSDINTLTLTFVYDSVYIEKKIVKVQADNNTSHSPANNRLVGGLGTAIQTGIDVVTNTIGAAVSVVTAPINNSSLLTKVKDFL